MKKALSLILISTSFAALAEQDKLNVIYGVDNRMEVYEASPFEQKLARSAATMVYEGDIVRSSMMSGVVELNQKTLRDWLHEQLGRKSNDDMTFCKDTKFADQPNPGMCSGFLIAPDLIMTAGHCVEIDNFCDSFKWVFDFKEDERTGESGKNIKEEDVYSCSKVVSSALNAGKGLDYGIVKLDRPVKGREPLKFRTEGTVKEGTEILVIGSPSGLPLKVAAGAKVRKNVHEQYFNSNLDTFQGNSGSAVFDAETGVVEGILVRGEQDYAANQMFGCIEVFQCKDDDCRGEDVSRTTQVPEVRVQNDLYDAAERGDMFKLVSVLRNKFWVDFYGKDGESALIKAARANQADAVDALLARGADINLQDAEGNTALHEALKVRAAKTIVALMNAGAKIDIKNNEGVTARSLIVR